MPAAARTRLPRPGPLPGDGGEPTSSPDLASELSRAIFRIQRTLRRRVGQAMASDGLSEGLVDLLRLARVRPGLRVSEAAAELSLAPNSVSTMVSRLVEAGLLERATAYDDRRVACLAITPAGRAVLTARRDSRRAALSEGLSQLDRSEQADLISALPALRRLVETLTGPGRSHP